MVTLNCTLYTSYVCKLYTVHSKGEELYKNMSIIYGLCTSCDAKIEVDASKDACICKACGSPFVTKKAIDRLNAANASVACSDMHNLTERATADASKANSKVEFVMILKRWSAFMLNAIGGDSSAHGLFLNKENSYYEKHGIFWGRAIKGDLSEWKIRSHLNNNRPWRPTSYDEATPATEQEKQKLFNTKIKHYIWEGVQNNIFADAFVDTAKKDGAIRFMKWAARI